MITCEAAAQGAHVRGDQVAVFIGGRQQPAAGQRRQPRDRRLRARGRKNFWAQLPESSLFETAVLRHVRL